MEIFKTNKKITYILTCVFMTIFLFGCKEKGKQISIFDGISESTYFTEAKTAIESKKPIAISFTAEWCPHCRKYKPVFFEVKDLFKDEVAFINIDVDDPNGSELSNRFQVKGIPTTAFVRPDGSIFKVQVGEIEKENLTTVINDLIKSKKRKRGEPVAPFPVELGEPSIQKKEEADVKPQELIKQDDAEEAPEIQPALKENGESKDQADGKSEESMDETESGNGDQQIDTNNEETEEEIIEIEEPSRDEAKPD